MTAVESRANHADYERVRARDDLFADIYDFYTDEAALLDSEREIEWLEILADDVSYQMPGRRTVYRKDGDGITDAFNHFEDDRLSLGLRIRRNVEIRSAYDRDPPPRYRRLITNLTVHRSGSPEEFSTESSILLLRNRFDNPAYSMISARREDLLRRHDDSFRLVKRTVLLDQSVVDAPMFNLIL